MSDSIHKQETTFNDWAFMEPLALIHRDRQANIAFARKGKTFQNIGSLTIDEVAQVLPELKKWLFEDAYFTINGYSLRKDRKDKRTGFHGVLRKESCLKTLNAVYADLDVGRRHELPPKSMTAKEALEILADLTWQRTDGKKGIVPLASITAQSGRGAYVFWLLREEGSGWDKPVTFKTKRSFEQELAIYKRINEAIYKRLEVLAADRIKDGARLFRVPETLHSKSGEKCIYHIGGRLGEGVITYTLSELAEFFEISILESSLPDSLSVKSKNPNPNKVRGAQELGAKRARDFVKLEQYRGGWNEGHRGFSLYTYAHFLKSSGLQFHEIKAALEAMAANCNPSYPSDKSDMPPAKIAYQVIGEGFKKYRRDSLVKWFNVTEDEAIDLELESIIPSDYYHRMRVPKRGMQQRIRRKLLVNIIEEVGLLSCRSLANLVNEKATLDGLSLSTTDMTIKRDLVALEYLPEPKKTSNDSGGNLTKSLF